VEEEEEKRAPPKITTTKKYEWTYLLWTYCGHRKKRRGGRERGRGWGGRE
jgi:hypothetical protein